MPVQYGVSRFNAVLAGVATAGPGGPRCPHRSAAGTENRYSVNEALDRNKPYHGDKLVVIVLNRFI